MSKGYNYSSHSFLGINIYILIKKDSAREEVKVGASPVSLQYCRVRAIRSDKNNVRKNIKILEWARKAPNFSMDPI